MKTGKKIIVSVLCAAMLTGTALEVGAWDYENHSPVKRTIKGYEDSFQSEDRYRWYENTRMYYDSNDKDLYFVDRALYAEGNKGNKEYYLSRCSGDQLRKVQENRIRYFYGLQDESVSFYDKDDNVISEGEFETQLMEYENNKNLISVNPSEGMRSFGPEQLHRTSYKTDPDFSFIRQYTLDPEEHTTAQLQSKVILPKETALRLTWKSSDSSVAEVDDQGKVTAKKIGKCTVSSEIEDVGTVETYEIIVEENLSESQKEARNTIRQYQNNEIYEKTMFDRIYELDDYRAGGHVITNIDDDDAYEMVTRSADKKTIKIYEILGSDIKCTMELTGVTQANMLYLHGGRITKVYFQTLKALGHNKTEVKIFQYNGPGKKMSNPLVCTIECDEKYGLFRKLYDSSGSVADINDSEYGYLTKVWKESFNDYCYDVISTSDTEKACDTDDDGKTWYYTGSGVKGINHFADNYYDSDEKPLYSAASTWHGQSYSYIEQMALNEILGRLNHPFKDPETTALMNKRPEYHADPEMTIEKIADLFEHDSFYYYSKFNYDNLSKASASVH